MGVVAFMIAYFKLVRLPNVFSAFADIIAGYFLAAYATKHEINWAVFAALCLISAALYLSGMAFNDIADREEDARVRPTRSIPSGAVSLKGAVICAVALMLIGLVAAALLGLAPMIVAAVLSVGILAYDFVCKGRTLAGPLALGVCRFSNILLGMSAAYNSPQVWETLRAAPVWDMPWLPAIASGLYGAGVTAFSAQEEEGKSRGALLLGGLLTWLGLAAAGVVFFGAKPAESDRLYPLSVVFRALGFIPLISLLFQLLMRTLKLVQTGSPDAARGLVLAGVKGYCLLDAGMLLLYGGRELSFPAVAAILMLFPGGWLRRWLMQREA